jgi:hypothetical protein
MTGNNNFVLTKREVCMYREISDRGLFLQTEPVGRGLYKQTDVRYGDISLYKPNKRG